MKLLALLWRVLRALGLTLVALVIFIEEWGWRPLSAWLARLAAWAPLAWLEARIRAAPPFVALVLFLVPALLLVPLKLVAVWLIHQGRVALGVTVIVAAKVVGTAVAGRLFVLVEPQLMQFRWFARVLGWWRITRRRVLGRLRAWPPWQATQRGWQRVALRLRRWWT